MLKCECMLLASLIAISSGCASYYSTYEASADRVVREILESKRHAAVDRWQKNPKLPAPEPDVATASPDAVSGQTRTLSLRDALQIAREKNRDYKTEVETLYLSALAASLQRHNFGPVLSNTISYVYSDGAAIAGSGVASAALGVSKIIPTGGALEATVSGAVDDDYEGSTLTVVSKGLSVSFDQPLLKGSGREVAYENLTQAERDVVYALRDFEIFRQDFTITVLRRYYAILRQKRVVENSRRTLDRFIFLRKRSDALFNVGKVSAIDKFRAAQEELTASNDLITEQESLKSLLDDFKLFLGMPPSASIDIEDIQPEAKSANIELRSAIAAALHNRLDLKNSQEQVEDAERSVRIAKNGLLPDLDLTAGWALDSARTARRTVYEGSHSVGLSLVLPLDKVADRNSLRRAQITLQRRQRSYDLAQDNVRLDVLNTYRRLRRLANSVRIEKANVALAERRVQNSQLRFEAGTLGNRDVVEAQSAKLRAQNNLIRAILDYEIARLQLKRDIGILFIRPDGTWQE